MNEFPSLKSTHLHLENSAREIVNIYQSIEGEIGKIPMNDFFSHENGNPSRDQKIEFLVRHSLSDKPSMVSTRVYNEFYNYGPLTTLLDDESITEILVNGPDSIWLEKNGNLCAHTDYFFSELSFRNIVDRLCQEANTHITIEHPCADGSFRDFRICIIGSWVTGTSLQISLRRHPKNPWTFSKLSEVGWCSEHDLELLRRLTETRKNFLVVGSTSSGKTSVLNAFLNFLPENERVIIIEDTPELRTPNKVSTRLLTREDPQGVLPKIDQSVLVKNALRLRPDRIVMGEMRGNEAKDFLMALATGHLGSFGTLHAMNAQQALLRLEMLIQMGAPHWDLTAIRRLIQISLDYVVVTERIDGVRRFEGLYKICSLEEHGFLLEKI